MISTCARKRKRAEWHEITIDDIGGIPIVTYRRVRSFKAGVERAVADGVSLRRADLMGADLSDLNLTGADFRGANLRFASLQRSVIADANFAGADLTNTDFRGVDMTGFDINFTLQLVGRR